MTLKVRFDQLHISKDSFAAEVMKHCAALNEYRVHLRGVAEDAKNPDLKDDERRIAFPGPDAPNLIKEAIRLDETSDRYVPDYEFVGPPLAERKAALTQRVREMEQAAIEANIPSAKRRHWQYRAQDILSAAAPMKPSADEQSQIDDLNARLGHESAIQRHCAKLEHDIADLTDETIDAFEVAPFNG